MKYVEGKGFVVNSDDLKRPAQTIPCEMSPYEADKAAVVRTFDSGANRDVDHNKHDYEGFLSPLVIERFGSYMHKNRHLRDGSIRDSDNWQKGIPLHVYMKSMWRHFLSIWKAHRELMRLEAELKDPQRNAELRLQLEEDLMALYFNVQGYAHELLKR